MKVLDTELRVLLNQLINLLNRIGNKKQEGRFTPAQRAYAIKRLAELEARAKHFRKLSNRHEVYVCINSIRKELDMLPVERRRHELPKRTV